MARVFAASGAPILHSFIAPTLIKLALPTVLVLLMTVVLSIAETYSVSSLGTDAIAGASLVVHVLMLMTMMLKGGRRWRLFGDRTALRGWAKGRGREPALPHRRAPYPFSRSVQTPPRRW